MAALDLKTDEQIYLIIKTWLDENENFDTGPVLLMVYGSYHEEKLLWISQHTEATGSAPTARRIEQWIGDYTEQRLRTLIDAALGHLNKLVRNKVEDEKPALIAETQVSRAEIAIDEVSTAISDVKTTVDAIKAAANGVSIKQGLWAFFISGIASFVAVIFLYQLYQATKENGNPSEIIDKIIEGGSAPEQTEQSAEPPAQGPAEESEPAEETPAGPST